MCLALSPAPWLVSSCPVSGVVGTDPFSSSIRQPGSQPGGDPSLLPSLLPPPFCHSQPDHPYSWSCLQHSGGKGALVSVSSGHLLGLGAETIPSIYLSIPHFLYLLIYSHILYSRPQTPSTHLSACPPICSSSLLLLLLLLLSRFSRVQLCETPQTAAH